jgi:hypothetical protein
MSRSSIVYLVAGCDATNREKAEKRYDALFSCLEHTGFTAERMTAIDGRATWSFSLHAQSSALSSTSQTVQVFGNVAEERRA